MADVIIQVLDRTLNCIFLCSHANETHRGENYVIDWKKSDKKKSNLKETYDGPVQVAAYIGAINTSNLYPFVVNDAR